MKRLLSIAALAACSRTAPPAPAVATPAPAAAAAAPATPAPPAAVAAAATPAPPAPAAAAAPPAPAAAPVAMPAPIRSHGKIYAVVTVEKHVSECSNAGGEHYRLTVAAPGAHDPRTAHFGAHQSSVALFPTDLFVAEIEPGPRVDEDHDDNPDSDVSGWCLGGLRADGEAQRLVPVADAADAAAKLAAIAKDGLPANAPTMTPQTADRRGIAIARAEGSPGHVALVTGTPGGEASLVMSLIPDGTIMVAPDGTTPGATYLVIAHELVTNEPAWEATRVLPIAPDRVDATARALVSGAPLP